MIGLRITCCCLHLMLEISRKVTIFAIGSFHSFFWCVVKLCFGLISVCYFGEVDVVMTPMPPFFFVKNLIFYLEIKKKVVSLWC